MNNRSSRLAAMVAALLVANAAVSADSPTYQFDIRGTTLSRALEQFASRTGLHIAYFTMIAEGRTAPPVVGTLTAEQALSILLSTSGLTFDRIDAGVIAIRAKSADAESTTATGSPTAMESGAASYGMHLASADTPAAEQRSASSGEPGAEPASHTAWTLDEVIVTGTNIRGVSNDVSPMMIFDRGYIERSGYSNMMQLVDSLPINFKGGAAGASEMAPYGQAFFSGQNLNRGTGFNLRGLGGVATLTLINGRRVAPSAQGQFVDVSTIPLTAVERIEILADGASAIYGADAVAGVVNIILRKDFEGAETGLQYGSDDEGTTDEKRVSQTLGAKWASGNALVVGELYERDPLDVADRDFIVEAGAASPTYLLPHRRLGTLLFALDQRFTDALDLSSNVLYSYEEVQTMDSTVDSPVLGTASPITNQWSATVGLGYDAFADWRLSLDTTVAQVATKSGFEYQDRQTGEYALLVKDYHDTFKTWSVDVKADGSLFALPAGKVRLAIGASYREDDLRSTRVRVVPAVGFEVRALDARDVTAAFAELYAPLIGEAQNMPFAKRVDLSLAVRRDDYSDFGSTSNPKMGLVWTPVEGLDLRAAYSTSFRAPSVAEKAYVARGVEIYTDYIDAPGGQGQEPVPIFFLSGSAPLLPEESKNLSFGFTFRPASLTGTELTVNYFKTDYTNRISTPPYDNGALSRRADYGNLITDLADDAAAQAFLDQRLAQGDAFFDYIETGVTGIRYALDLRQKNAARTQLSGFDVTLAHSWRQGDNAFSADLNVTHLKELLTSLTHDSTTFDQVDRYNQPLDWRARALLTWLRGGWSTTVVVSYADGYINDSQLLDESIDAWTTLDLNVSYEFDRAGATLLSGTKISLGIDNVLDEDPPFASAPAFAQPIGFDVFNADAMGRFITARVTKRW
jgi:outer membrane receptor protein involved in Fe transport